MSSVINQHVMIAGSCYFCGRDNHSIYTDEAEYEICIDRDSEYVYTTTTGDITNDLIVAEEARIFEVAYEMGINLPAIITSAIKETTVDEI